MSFDKKKARPPVRTKTPRPDELTRDAFEFIAAIDDYKRRHMRSFLEDEEVLQVLFELGYRCPGFVARPTKPQLDSFAQARQRYRRDHGRLFPTWSEVYDLLKGLGYTREQRDNTAA